MLVLIVKVSEFQFVSIPLVPQGQLCMSCVNVEMWLVYIFRSREEGRTIVEGGYVIRVMAMSNLDHQQL